MLDFAAVAGSSIDRAGTAAIDLPQQSLFWCCVQYRAPTKNTCTISKKARLEIFFPGNRKSTCGCLTSHSEERTISGNSGWVSTPVSC